MEVVSLVTKTTYGFYMEVVSLVTKTTYRYYMEVVSLVTSYIWILHGGCFTSN